MNGTGSPKSKLLGLATLAGVATLLLFAFAFTGEDRVIEESTGEVTGQFDSVRLLYIHVPVAIGTYVMYGVCALASAIYLFKRNLWADTMAHASAEIGTLFCALTLITGSIWGRPVWNTWWEWGDVRLMSTLILFLLFVGYLAFRSIDADPETQAKRAAVIALIAVLDIPVINRSVEWWENRTLHQSSSLIDGQLDDLMLFSVFLGIVVVTMVQAWLLTHRFRVGWLERQAERSLLDTAVEERRAEARAGVEEAVTVGSQESP